MGNLALVHTVAPLTVAEARAITAEIVEARTEAVTSLQRLEELLHEAKERRAWEALGYASWREYAIKEFGLSQASAYDLLTRAQTVAAIEDAGGEISDASEISIRDARALKQDLPAVTEEIRTRVGRGEDPAEATRAVVEKKRAERKAGAPKAQPAAGPKEPGAPEEDEGEHRIDVAAEIEFLASEVQRLERVVESLQTDEPQKEIADWARRYAQLEARVRQLMTEGNEAKRQATYQGKLLKKIRETLCVERDSQIVTRLQEVVR